MLKAGAPPPDGRFSDHSMLEPIRDYPQRHASAMLAFEAAAEACALAMAGRTTARTSPADAA
jgi:NifU-like protein involved in Fe-S cluster formation